MDYFESEFWTYFVLQLVNIEPCVQHAVFSLGALHKRLVVTSQKNEGPVNLYENAIYRFSLLEYNNSIRELNILLEAEGPKAVRMALLCCILYSCIENLLMDHEAALNHMLKGIIIWNGWIKELKAQNRLRELANPADFEGSLAVQFLRIAKHVPIYCNSNDVPPVLHYEDHSQHDKPACSQPTIDLAQKEIEQLVVATFKFHADHAAHKLESEDIIPPAVSKKYRALKGRLRGWEKKFRELLHSHREDPTSKAYKRATLLIIRYRFSISFHQLEWWKDAKAREECEEDCEALLSLIELILFPDRLTREHDSETYPDKAMTMCTLRFNPYAGLIPSLFYMTTPRASISIRKWAILLLRNANFLVSSKRPILNISWF